MSDYSDRVLADGASFYWNLNEASGNFNDVVANQKFVTGAVKPTYRRNSLPGTAWGVSFPSGSSPVNHQGNINLGPLEWAFEAWVQLGATTINTTQIVIHRAKSFYVVSRLGGILWFVEVNTDGDPTEYAWNNEESIGPGWHHIVVSKHDSEVFLYLDGDLSDSYADTDSTQWLPNERMSLGWNVAGDATKRWRGVIDEVALYGDPLTDDDVADHYLLGVTATSEISDLEFNGIANFTAGALRHALTLQMSTRAIIDLNSDLSIVSRAQPWWDHDYPYRRYLGFTASPDGLDEGHPLEVILNKDLLQRQKLRTDFADLEVVYLRQERPEDWVFLPHRTVEDSSSITVTFPAAEEAAPNEVLDGKYYVYYGNRGLVDIIPPLDYTTEDWFITLDASSKEIDYSRPGEHWNFQSIEGFTLGYTDVRHAKLTFAFWGDRIQFYAFRGPVLGVMEYQVNDGEWIPYDLYSKEYTSTDEPVVEIAGLPAGKNYFRVRNSGLGNPATQRKAVAFAFIKYAKHRACVDVMEQADETKNWASGVSGVL